MHSLYKQKSDDRSCPTIFDFFVFRSVLAAYVNNFQHDSSLFLLHLHIRMHTQFAVILNERERWLEMGLRFAFTWCEMMRFPKHFSLCLSSDIAVGIVVNQFHTSLFPLMAGKGKPKIALSEKPHDTRVRNHNKNSHNYNNAFRVVVTQAKVQIRKKT